jgi:hypothetical protein
MLGMLGMFLFKKFNIGLIKKGINIINTLKLYAVLFSCFIRWPTSVTGKQKDHNANKSHGTKAKTHGTKAKTHGVLDLCLILGVTLKLRVIRKDFELESRKRVQKIIKEKSKYSTLM